MYATTLTHRKLDRALQVLHGGMHIGEALQDEDERGSKGQTVLKRAIRDGPGRRALTSVNTAIVSSTVLNRLVMSSGTPCSVESG
jgi:hypothetical protein